MRSPLRNALFPITLTLLCLACPIAWAETGFLVLHVRNVQQRPIIGLQIQEIPVQGESEARSAITDQNGKARTRLAPQTTENSWVSLQILKSPPGANLMMVSPWDYKERVPSFEDEAKNFVEVVVVQRGERAALESGTVLKALASQINKANAPKSADKQAEPTDPKANLEAVAKQYGYTAEELDKAIRAWGATATDPYDKGVADLYAGSYEKATANLQESLRQREQKLATAQKDVADAAFFLGLSLYQQGKYKEAAAAFQRCLQVRPDDATVLNNTAVSLEEAGDYSTAEPLCRRALDIDEKALGPNHLKVARDLNNLAALLYAKGEYAAAEPLQRRALDIRERALGPNHPDVAQSLNNLGLLLEAKGDYAGAEPLYRRALTIDEKTLGPDDPRVARDLNNLAGLLYAKGDYAGAEPLFRRTLTIKEKTLGPDHPDVATGLNNLAEVLVARGDYAEAEMLFWRAVLINAKALGPDHRYVAATFNNLGALYRAKGDYAGAELLYRRALSIDEKALGADHADVATDLNNLAVLLAEKGDFAGAEPLMRRAVAIDEKTLGPDHPQTRLDKKHLDAILQDSAKAAAAKATVPEPKQPSNPN